jgi:glutaconate CoA-transferase, subunit B
VTSLHPGVTQEAARAACGWPLRFSDRLATTAAPSATELRVLRELQARTDAAHR